MTNAITNKIFPAVIIHLNVIAPDGKIMYEGTGDYSDAEYRRWMGETCRKAFGMGFKVTTTPVEE